MHMATKQIDSFVLNITTHITNDSDEEITVLRWHRTEHQDTYNK